MPARQRLLCPTAVVPPADGCWADAEDDSSSDGWSDTSSSANEGSLGERRLTGEGRMMGWNPLLGTHAVSDSDDATYVIVFTRAREPGSVDSEEKILDPLVKARRIFMLSENDPIEGLGKETVTAAEYHRIVREKIQALLISSGFICSSFPSVDGDETFLKIYLDPEAETTCALAEHFEYGMPLSRDCYESAEKITNKAGWTCCAHTEFTSKLRQEGKLQPFRRVDLIRIAHRHLSSLVNLEELLLQEFISTHFPAATFDELRALKWHWSLSPLHCSTQLVPKQVRDYFGAKISFYFHFYIFYTRSLCVLGLVALSVFLVDEKIIPTHMYAVALVRIGFGAAVAFWAVLFEIMLVRSIARTAQGWGAKEGHKRVARVTRARFDPKLVGTRRESQLSQFATLCSVSYCLLFIVGVMVIQSRRLVPVDQTVKTWLVAALIIVAKQGWSRIAPKLTELENHKTQQRFDDALILRLSGFKIFFLLWPALNIFMFQSFTKAYCGGTQEAAAKMFYSDLPLNGSSRQWPRDVNAGDLNQDTFKELLHEYYLTGFQLQLALLTGSAPGDQYCLSYCLPQEWSDCVRVRDEQGVDCRTNCHWDLEYQVLSQFVLHVASSILFAVVPMLLTRRAIRQEVSATQQQNRAAEYSDLEVQAKCQINAKYAYGEWGGSFVEDFLELMLGFAYISIFAMVRPVMILIATVAQLVEYSLIVLRMRLVTGRPYPEQAVDIGKWKVVIVMIGTVAVFFNGYIAAFVIRPAPFTHPLERMLLFLSFGSVSLLGRTTVRNLAPDMPHDVRLIDDYNADVLRKLRPVERSIQFEKDRDKCDVDIRLRPVDGPDVGTMPLGLGRATPESVQPLTRISTSHGGGRQVTRSSGAERLI